MAVLGYGKNSEFSVSISRKPQRLPYEQRPFWEASDPHSELQYLAWGWRDFGNYPALATPTPDWSFHLILHGSPVLTMPGDRIPLAAGHAISASPRLAGTLGFGDEPHRYTELLVWQWRQPPLVPALRSSERGYQICQLSVEARRRVQAAHLRIRHEVEDPDELTASLLHSIRFEVEVEFARGLFGKRLQNDEQLMVQTAVRWMHRHLQLRNPISVLSHYLQVSRSTVERAFDAVLKTPPSAYYLELRMQTAQKRLAEGKTPIKRIAYELGYKHPGDFSRAYKAFRNAAKQRR